MTNDRAPLSGDGLMSRAVDALDGSELNLLRDLFFRVGEELEQEIGDGIRLMAELKQQRAGLKPGPTWDDGRRRLQKSSFPDHVSRRTHSGSASSLDGLAGGDRRRDEGRHQVRAEAGDHGGRASRS